MQKFMDNNPIAKDWEGETEEEVYPEDPEQYKCGGQLASEQYNMPASQSIMENIRWHEDRGR